MQTGAHISVTTHDGVASSGYLHSCSAASNVATLQYADGSLHYFNGGDLSHLAVTPPVPRRAWWPPASQLVERANQLVAVPPLESRVYWAVSVCTRDAATLLEAVSAWLPQAFTPKSELHCTLCYMGRKRLRPDEEAPYVALSGTRCDLDVSFAVVTPRLAAAAVTIAHPRVAELCRNEHPHLTLALADGVPAVESNSALASVAAGTATDAEVKPLVLRCHGVVEARRF